MSFISDYVEFSSAICESPLLFHKAVSLFVLSAVVGRRVWVPLKGRPVHPNIFVIIVGPSSRVQKSTVGDIGGECIRFIEGVELYQDRCTRAYLGERLQSLSAEKGESVVSIYVPEMRTAFNEMTLQEGIMEVLTRLYDCPQSYEYRLKQNTPGGRVMNMLKPCVSMLACSTPEWLVTGLGRDEVGGGFAGRSIIIFCDKPIRRDAYEEQMPVRARDAEQRVLDRLTKISKLEGPMTMDEGARRIWTEFRMAQDDMHVDAALRAFHDRMHSHMLKVASLISVSRTSKLVISEKDMFDTVELLTEMEPHMARALSGIALSKVNIEGDRIINVIKEWGGVITRGNLVRALYNAKASLSSSDLDAVLNVLEGGGMLRRVAVRTHEGKRLANGYELLEPEDDADAGVQHINNLET